MGAFSNNPSGVRIEVNSDAVELNIKHIESMLTDNPDMRQRIQDAIRKDMWAARNAVVRNMAGIFANGDPAEARRAVRNIVTQKWLGGNLNIMEMKKGTAKWKVRQVDRKVEQNPHMRGGNRVKRSFTTIRMHGYEGKARGMILRWVNTGAYDRETRLGKRGSIAPRHFFRPLAEAALGVVSQHLAQIIEQEVENVFNANNP